MSEAELLAHARSGDRDAFGSLIAPYQAELQLHCYRMLGSLHDAEDITQEVLVRAWKHLPAFDGRSSIRTWLHRIATNRCLTRRSRVRPELPVASVPVPPAPNASDIEVVALQPYPDVLLDGVSAVGPDAVYELRESISLAFLTVIQLLPPRQRVVLLLRDVLGFSAAETAEVLDASPAAVNSGLQRARAALAPHQTSGRLVVTARRPDDATERSLLQRYLAAWHASNVPGLLALLREDALLTMPPFPAAYRGRAAIGEFLRVVPAGGQLDRITLIPTRANLQPAVAAYVHEQDGQGMTGYGVMVLSLGEKDIVEITGFADPELLLDFGLPTYRER